MSTTSTLRIAASALILYFVIFIVRMELNVSSQTRPKRAANGIHDLNRVFVSYDAKSAPNVAVDAGPIGRDPTHHVNAIPVPDLLTKRNEEIKKNAAKARQTEQNKHDAHPQPHKDNAEQHMKHQHHHRHHDVGNEHVPASPDGDTPNEPEIEPPGHLGDSRVAYCVVVSNEEFVDGTLVMGRSFHNHSQLVQSKQASLVAIVPQKALSDESLDRMRRSGWDHIVIVPDLGKEAPRSNWAGTLNKLYMFNLTEYSRVATFDVDMLMMRSPDIVFDNKLPNEKWIGALGNNPKKNPYFQTGMMLIIPSKATFDWMMHDFRTDPVNRGPNGRDGRIIRSFYGNRYISVQDQLSAHLGVHEPLTRVIGYHYRGEWKPWFNREKPPVKGSRDKKPPSLELGDAYRRWWATYEAMHNELFVNDPIAADAPPGYNPKLHVWLMRHSKESYMQPLRSVDIARRNLTYPHLIITKSAPGQSCEEACSQRQAICREDALSFSEVNKCELLEEYFGCSECSLDYPSAEEPACDAESRRCYANSLHHKLQRPTCDARKEGVMRLCTCLPVDNAFEKPVAVSAAYRIPRAAAEMANVTLPEDPDLAHHVSGCLPSRTDWFHDDSACRKYLSDFNNVDYLTPVGRTLLVGRTAKLLAHYKEAGIRAVVKFPQHSFPHEAHSEATAHAVDRVLGVNRVPPTAFVFFPIDRLKQGFQNVSDEDMRDTTVKFAHMQVWSVVERSTTYTKLINDVKHLGVSVQLWINDVHRLADTVLAVPQRHWLEWYGKMPPAARHPWADTSLRELSTMMAFDFVIGNDDRTVDKNCYVAGSCRKYCLPASSHYHVGSARIVLIDHGRSVHYLGNPEMNPLTETPDKVFKFPRALVQSLLDFSHNVTAVGSLKKTVLEEVPDGNDDDEPGKKEYKNTLDRYLLRALPEMVVAVLKERPIQAIQDRLERLLVHTLQCVKEHGEGQVLAW